ncbi:flavodoxin [Arthrobacter globiformis]|uniref:flavodoxin n=1 Tax=Arthrobacter globiformis TaxID=1665 RepID=UPI00278AB156|nr:flavodoxin [Arthrobacter globiformis]MDQ1059846.1 flavodoxin [Arthrobacter globiformis]
MISGLIGCDVHRIEAAVPYPADYDATVARNVREQNEDSRPAIANPLPSIDHYDTVLLASGIWNIRAPMIMTTFTESHDFAGKTVYPPAGSTSPDGLRRPKRATSPRNNRNDGQGPQLAQAPLEWQRSPF